MAGGFKAALGGLLGRLGGFPAAPPAATGVPVSLLDDALWQIKIGSDALGWRDVNDECGDLVYSHVRPGGPASASCTIPGDVWGIGYNELRPDMRLIVYYAGEWCWSGFILPRPTEYEGQ